MIFVEVPAINGLGRTDGCEKTPCKLIAEITKKGLGKKIQVIELNLNKQDLSETQKTIFKESVKVFKDNKDNDKKIIFLGGDHSISFPIVNAFKQVYSLPFLFVMDAHVDFMLPMKEPTHEEWLRALIEQGFDKESIILVGARKIYDEEKDFFNKVHVKIINKEEILDFLENSNSFHNLDEHDAVYLSIDVDVLDSDIVNATGYPEKDGLSVEQLKEFLRVIFKLKNLKAVDIVEINSEKDLNNSTINLISEILIDLIKKEEKYNE